MRISTGIPGLDHILHGGLLPGRTYLVHGEPGTGKTTLGLHFLSCDPGSGLLISFSQTADRIRADAEALGLDIANLTILDFTPPAETFSEIETYDIFSAAEVEREPLSRHISKVIEEKKPSRIFVDSFGSFRNLDGRRISVSPACAIVLSPGNIARWHAHHCIRRNRGGG